MGAGKTLTEDDRAQIEAHGLKMEEVQRQLDLFAHPPAAVRLVRPCTPGDGIVRLDPDRYEHYQSHFENAAEDGRFSKFVPASGAASRMFQALLAARLAPDADPEPVARLLSALDRFPFYDDLRRELERRGKDLEAERASGNGKAVLDALLDDDGLGYASTAKALIPFHRGADGGLTPLEEHLVEAAEHLRSSQDRCRIHFTIPQHQELLFRERLREITARLETRYEVSFDISLSIQGPETDTVGGDPTGGPYRDADGRLVFRPGGHGSLLVNLERFHPDLVFLRNIDNIQPAHRRREVLRFNRILGGYLVHLEGELTNLLSRVERVQDEDEAIDAELERAAELLGRPEVLEIRDRPARAKQAFLVDLLDRPLRVAGVVPNTGEPGGGPFWVAGKEGETPQIVELSRVNLADPEQKEIVAASTHFNPVHLVCRMRDHRGRSYETARFVDQDAVFLSRKSHQGEELLALERPGLWNGSMARWNTVFVEVPGAVFAPVKTVFDLLRPEHQPETER